MTSVALNEQDGAAVRDSLRAAYDAALASA